MADFIRRPSGLLVPPEPRIQRPQHCDLFGGNMMAGSGPPKPPVQPPDPYFAYVKGLLQPLATDTTVKDYSSNGYAVGTSGTVVEDWDNDPYPSPFHDLGYSTLKLTSFSNFPGVAFPAGSFTLPGGAQFVIEALWHPGGFGSGVFLDMRQVNGNFVTYAKAVDASNGGLGWYDGTNREGSATYPLNAYTYSVYSYTGGDLRMYVNGTLSTYITGVSIANGSSSQPYLFSSIGGASDYMRGRVAAWRFTLGTNRGFTGPTIPMMTAPFPIS